MKNALALALGLFCCVAIAQERRPAARIQLLDRIVAVVNSEVITQYELNERVAQIQKQLRQRNTPLPEAGVLERQVLERLIIDKAQLQLARDTALRVDDLQLDRAIERIASDNRMPLAEFRRTLERDGIAFDKFREDVRIEITLSRLREREVDNKIAVSESEIDNYLSEPKSEARDAVAEYNLSHILVRLPEQSSPEQIERQRVRAELVLQQLRNGADFAQVAAGFSDASDALQGGAMGWRSQNRLPDLFVQALSRMHPGEVGPILRSPAGFHVLKLIDRRGGAEAAAAPFVVDQTHARHILVRTNEVVSEDEAKRKLNSLRERIQNGASFAELARLNSDDGSASKGGDLGWLYPGDTVPEFERAMNDLPEKQVSQPIRSPFGFHLIEVLERRKADMSTDRKRLEARKALRERKADEAYQDWIRQLRDKTYVEYRLEDK
jgi:peptidyl-prolyl cis-trans isomerase SurA